MFSCIGSRIDSARMSLRHGRICGHFCALSLFRRSGCITHGQSRKFDLVHVHNIPDFLIFSAWPAKRRGARLILDIHDIVPEFFVSKFGPPPQSLLVRSLRWVEKVSASVFDHVILSNHLYTAHRGISPHWLES